MESTSNPAAQPIGDANSRFQTRVDSAESLGSVSSKSMYCLAMNGKPRTRIARRCASSASHEARTSAVARAIRSVRVEPNGMYWSPHHHNAKPPAGASNKIAKRQRFHNRSRRLCVCVTKQDRQLVSKKELIVLPRRTLVHSRWQRLAGSDEQGAALVGPQLWMWT
jgi:hypothetical protein